MTERPGAERGAPAPDAAGDARLEQEVGGGAVPPPAPAGAAEEPTVGTGSVFGIGCSIVTVLVILVGVAVFLLLRWLEGG